MLGVGFKDMFDEIRFQEYIIVQEKPDVAIGDFHSMISCHSSSGNFWIPNIVQTDGSMF